MVGYRGRFGIGIGWLIAALWIGGAGAATAEGALPPAAVFAATGAEQSYVVPAGVTLVSAAAAGAAGGGGCGGAAGGRGARVAADFAVSPGSVLFVEVGAVGTSGALPGNFCNTNAAGAFNGGGLNGPVSGGGGGGASDVRTIPRAEAGSLGSRLLVAGGGGGAGGGGVGPAAPGGDAGSAGGGLSAGGGATLSAPGAAGAANAGCNTNATAGVFGTGGDGAGDFPNAGGGGGGGGYWGGGGGGCVPGQLGSSGGGGSSYVASQATNASAPTLSVAPAVVTITPIEAPAPPQGPQGPQGLPGVNGAQGAAGPQGATGPQGAPGAPGATGVRGRTGPRGIAGRDARVTCRIAHRNQVKCTVKMRPRARGAWATTARLSHAGRTIARGRTNHKHARLSLHSTHHFSPGRYVLTLRIVDRAGARTTVRHIITLQ